MNICKHYSISGKVQGVFYRASAKAKADELGITGWVRNCANGDVEVEACGTMEQLAELKLFLQQGPSRAQIEKVVEENCETKLFSDFRVLR